MTTSAVRYGGSQRTEAGTRESVSPEGEGEGEEAEEEWESCKGKRQTTRCSPAWWDNNDIQEKESGRRREFIRERERGRGKEDGERRDGRKTDGGAKQRRREKKIDERKAVGLGRIVAFLWAAQSKRNGGILLVLSPAFFFSFFFRVMPRRFDAAPLPRQPRLFCGGYKAILLRLCPGSAMNMSNTASNQTRYSGLSLTTSMNTQ